MYRIKNSDTALIIKKGRIEEESGDAIINWCNLDLRSGPQSFYRIHNKAGMQLFDHTAGFEENVKECDCFTTMPGMLDVSIVFHMVVPTNKGNFLKCFNNLAANITEYKKENPLRNLSVYVPNDPMLCLAGIKTFLFYLGLDSVTVLYMTDNELEIIEDFFKPFIESSFLYKVEKFFWFMMDKIGGMWHK